MIPRTYAYKNRRQGENKKGVHSVDTAAIKQQVSMGDLAARLGLEFNRQGFAPCPFHTEKTGSFKIMPNDKGAHCFGCGVTADAVSLVRKILGLSFTEACGWLDEEYRLGIMSTKPLDYREQRKRREALLQSRQKQQEKEKRLDERQAEYWQAFDRWAEDDRNLRTAAALSAEWLEALKDIETADYLLESADIRRRAEEVKLNA